MVYIGIVGALSPLGLEVANFLREKKDCCRIVFYVDAGFQVSSPSNAMYATPEAALSFNQAPSLIVDCDDPITAVNRAKTYRFYSVPAIMCCTCMPEELDDLKHSYVAENQPAPSLFITPDYCTENIRLIDFFSRIAEMHYEDVDRMEIEVNLPSDKRINLARWLYFGSLLNDKLGVSGAKYSIKGNVCHFGDVIIKSVNDDTLAPEAEEVHARLFYGNKQHLCYTYMKSLNSNRTADSLIGIRLLLEWFTNHPDEAFSGKVFTDHLRTAMSFNKKSLP